MTFWAPFGLLSVTAALLAVPVTPALFELRKRGDVAPLPTSRHNARIENFAESFRARIEPLLSQLELCSTTEEVIRTAHEGMETLLIGSESFDFDPNQICGLAAVIGQNLTIPSGRVIQADIFASGNLHVGQGSAIRAALAQGDLILGEKSVALRWIHADGSVCLSTGSASYGRLSARESIQLRPGSSFQRMHAPRIVTAAPRDFDSELMDSSLVRSETLSRCEASELESAAYAGEALALRPRLRVHGDFALPAGESMEANVVASGNVRFCAGSRFLGNAKSYKDTILEDGASVQGSIVCGATLHLGPNCYVAGPIMAERDVVCSRGITVGAPDSLTTIACSSIRIAGGGRLHGTIWARVLGTVED
jgi:hypothetical protein